MKVLLILLVLLGVAYYFFFYQEAVEPKAPVAANPSAPAAPVQVAAPVDSHSFDVVTAQLRQDMNAIPTALDGPGHPPTNALTIKRKLFPNLGLHAEYRTLYQACDLIIRADAQRTTFQQSCRSEEARADFNNALVHDESSHSAFANHHVPGGMTPPPTTTTVKAIHQRVESSWGTYRAETDGQVKQLLASLEGKHL